VDITIDGEEIANVKEFKYLGSIQNHLGNMDDEMERRRASMLKAYGSFQHVLTDKRLNLNTRLMLFNVIIVPHGYYRCQAWNLSRSNIKSVETIYFWILGMPVHLLSTSFKELEDGIKKSFH
jgi:hypothetical protein